jgi:hypothetical protein
VKDYHSTLRNIQQEHRSLNVMSFPIPFLPRINIDCTSHPLRRSLHLVDKISSVPLSVVCVTFNSKSVAQFVVCVPMLNCVDVITTVIMAKVRVVKI